MELLCFLVIYYALHFVFKIKLMMMMSLTIEGASEEESRHCVFSSYNCTLYCREGKGQSYAMQYMMLLKLLQ